MTFKNRQRKSSPSDCNFSPFQCYGDILPTKIAHMAYAAHRDACARRIGVDPDVKQGRPRGERLSGSLVFSFFLFFPIGYHFFPPFDIFVY